MIFVLFRILQGHIFDLRFLESFVTIHRLTNYLKLPTLFEVTFSLFYWQYVQYKFYNIILNNFNNNFVNNNFTTKIKQHKQGVGLPMDIFCTTNVFVCSLSLKGDHVLAEKWNTRLSKSENSKHKLNLHIMANKKLRWIKIILLLFLLYIISILPF